MLEKLSMTGKHVIITGAGRGLGKQMALALADAGADIACAARTQEQIEATADEVRERGRQALAITTDVAKSEEVDALVARAIEEWGRVDVFIANAGAGGAAVRNSLVRRGFGPPPRCCAYGAGHPCEAREHASASLGHGTRRPVPNPRSPQKAAKSPLTSCSSMSRIPRSGRSPGRPGRSLTSERSPPNRPPHPRPDSQGIQTKAH